MFKNKISYLDKQRYFYVALSMVLPFLIGGQSFAMQETTFANLQKNNGKLIALVGISGSGKSSLAKELSVLTNAEVFLEPEEDKWPELITQSKVYGEFAAFTSFRNLRVKNLYDAQEIKRQGRVAIVDSYYDKITSYYLEKPGMDWLIPQCDPYFETVKLMTLIDKEQLPDADCLVLLDIDIDTWMQFIQIRNRERDGLPGFQENIHLYKDYIEEAAIQLSVERGIKLIRFQQVMNNIKTQALQLQQLLIQEKVL